MFCIAGFKPTMVKWRCVKTSPGRFPPQPGGVNISGTSSGQPSSWRRIMYYLFAESKLSCRAGKSCRQAFEKELRSFRKLDNLTWCKMTTRKEECFYEKNGVQSRNSICFWVITDNKRGHRRDQKRNLANFIVTRRKHSGGLIIGAAKKIRTPSTGSATGSGFDVIWRKSVARRRCFCQSCSNS